MFGGQNYIITTYQYFYSRNVMRL